MHNADSLPSLKECLVDFVHSSKNATLVTVSYSIIKGFETQMIVK